METPTSQNLRNFASFGKMDPFVVVERVKSPQLERGVRRAL